MLAPPTSDARSVRTVRLVGVGQPRPGLAEVGNGLAGRLGLDGVDDALVECLE